MVLLQKLAFKLLNFEHYCWWGLRPPPILTGEYYASASRNKKLFEKKQEPEFLEEQIRNSPPVEDGEEE